MAACHGPAFSEPVLHGPAFLEPVLHGPAFLEPVLHGPTFLEPVLHGPAFLESALLWRPLKIAYGRAAFLLSAYVIAGRKKAAPCLGHFKARSAHCFF